MKPFLRPCVIALVLTGLAVSLSSGCRQNPDKLVFGYVQPAGSGGGGAAGASSQAGPLARPAEALGKAISRSLGIPIQMFAFDTPMGLVDALSAGQADICLVNPMAYAVAHRDGAQVILKGVHDRQDSYRSVIFSCSETGPARVEELKGKALAFVDPASRAGYLYPAAFLIRSGLVLDGRLVIFKGDQTAVVKAVLDGEVEAGACEESAFIRACRELAGADEALQVIAHTSPVPYDTVAVRSGLSPELVDRIKRALLEAVADADGAKALTELSRCRGLVEAQERDYDVIREMADILNLDLEVLAEGG